MSNNQTLNFDFDEWSKLYRDDPEAFEQRRLDWCQRMIDQASDANRRRLSGLQFQINMETKRSPNALKSCLRLSRLMWDKFHDLRNELQALAAHPASDSLHNRFGELHASQHPSAPRHSAEILPFRLPYARQALAKSGGS